MSFESSLNLVWLLLGICALTCTIRSAYSKRALYVPRRAWLHLVGTALIVAALFPFISATDDVLRIEHFIEQQKPGGAPRNGPAHDLLRLYQTLDSPMVTHARQTTVTLVFVVLVSTLLVQLIERTTSFQSGRSPPSLIPA